jgi:hypothetical protein
VGRLRDNRYASNRSFLTRVCTCQWTFDWLVGWLVTQPGWSHPRLIEFSQSVIIHTDDPGLRSSRAPRALVGLAQNRTYSINGAVTHYAVSVWRPSLQCMMMHALCRNNMCGCCVGLLSNYQGASCFNFDPSHPSAHPLTKSWCQRRITRARNADAGPTH